MNIFILKIAIAALAISSLSTTISADDLDDILQVELRPGWRRDDGTHIAALQISLAPGWKTYWRQPGDTGIPPKFNFTGSSNLNVIDVLYPIPNITWQDGSRSIGYEGEVVFPIIVQPRNKNRVKLVGQIEIGVCKEICIPVSLIVSERLPVGAPKDTVIEAAIQTLPKLGMEKILCKFSQIADGMRLSLTLLHPSHDIRDATIELGNSNLWIETPKAEQVGGQIQITANILTPTGNPVSVVRGDVITTIFGANTVTEYRGCHGF